MPLVNKIYCHKAITCTQLSAYQCYFCSCLWDLQSILAHSTTHTCKQPPVCTSTRNGSKSASVLVKCILTTCFKILDALSKSWSLKVLVLQLYKNIPTSVLATSNYKQSQVSGMGQQGLLCLWQVFLSTFLKCLMCFQHLISWSACASIVQKYLYKCTCHNKIVHTFCSAQKNSESV